MSWQTSNLIKLDVNNTNTLEFITVEKQMYRVWLLSIFIPQYTLKMISPSLPQHIDYTYLELLLNTSSYTCNFHKLF